MYLICTAHGQEYTLWRWKEESFFFSFDLVSIHLCRFFCVLSFVSQDLITVLLPRVLPATTEGLQDLDDDVRAVAAGALIPVVEGLVQLLTNKVRGKISPLKSNQTISVTQVLYMLSLFKRCKF